MVEQSDRAPLLDWEEEVGRAEPNPAVPAPHSGGFRAAEPAERGAPSANGANNGWSAGGGSAPAARGWSAHPGPEGDAYGSGTDEEGDCAFPGPSIKPRAVPRWEEKDQIVAVFVVTFDTRSGESESCSSTAAIHTLFGFTLLSSLSHLSSVGHTNNSTRHLIIFV